MRILSVVLLLALSVSALAFELSTRITQDGDTTTLQTIGYAKVNLLKQAVSLRGSIVVTGTLTVTGTANIVMWSKVGGAYYFSKIPGLQKVKDTKNLNFKIPFNAADKTVTEVVIEVEMLSAGSVSISELHVGNTK
jgi:hypothetical protein